MIAVITQKIISLSAHESKEKYQVIPFLLFYCAKNNVVQPLGMVYKIQAGSLGYNVHLIMRNDIMDIY